MREFERTFGLGANLGLGIMSFISEGLKLGASRTRSNRCSLFASGKNRGKATGEHQKLY